MKNSSTLSTIACLSGLVISYPLKAAFASPNTHTKANSNSPAPRKVVFGDLRATLNPAGGPYYKKVTDINLIPANHYLLRKIYNPANENIWAVPCNPIFNNQTIEKAAYWTQQSYIRLHNQYQSPRGWFAPPTTHALPDPNRTYHDNAQIGKFALVAIPSGFNHFSSDWDVSGGTPTGASWFKYDTILTNNKNSNYSIYTYLSPGDSNVAGEVTNFQGFNLGSKADASDLVRTTTITVNVKEDDSGSMQHKIKSTFKINWHPPLDNAVPLPGFEEGHKVYDCAPAMTTGTINHQETLNTEGGLEVWLTPNPWDCLVGLGGTDWFVGGTVFTLASGGLSLFPEALVPAEGVLSKVLPSMSLSLGISGTGYATTTLEPSTIKKMCYNDINSWEEAIDETRRVASGNKRSGEEIRVDPEGMVIGDHEGIFDTTFSTNHIWNQFTMTPYIRRDSKQYAYTGDAYDDQGYCGKGSSSFEIPSSSPRQLAYYKLIIVSSP